MATDKCADCGFLSLRNVDTGEFCEVPAEYRETGALLPPLSKVTRYVPLCFVRAFNLRAEYVIDCPTANDAQAAHLLSVLNTPRGCGERQQSIGWTQGFSPKEHLQMRMLEDQRVWQQDESKAQRDWQAEEARKSDERHQENLKAVNTAGWSNVWAALAAAILGAVVGAWFAGKPNITIQTPPPVVQAIAAPLPVIDTTISH